ncbi:MAG: TetR/AcrR family transcriptional regulator [Pseudomonadota bacterium]
MARPKATPEQKEQVRRSIQSAAAELYREQGLSAISARAVATKAGVSVGTIYSYFDDLTGLMQSLWTERVAEQEDVFRALASEQEIPLDRIEVLLEAYLKFGLEQAVLYRNALMFVRPATLEMPAKEALTGYAFPTLIQQAIEDGQALETIIPGDAAELTQLLWSGVHGALALPVNMDRLALKPATEMVEATVAGLLRMLRAELASH